MFLSQELATANMFKIKHALGLPNVSIEYPCFLSITIANREFHAGYQVEWDEALDQETFEIYEFTDGYNIGRTITLSTSDTFEELAKGLRLAMKTLLEENAEIYALTAEH